MYMYSIVYISPDLRGVEVVAVRGQGTVEEVSSLGWGEGGREGGQYQTRRLLLQLAMIRRYPYHPQSPCQAQWESLHCECVCVCGGGGGGGGVHVIHV